MPMEEDMDMPMEGDTDMLTEEDMDMLTEGDMDTAMDLHSGSQQPRRGRSTGRNFTPTGTTTKKKVIIMVPMIFHFEILQFSKNQSF